MRVKKNDLEVQKAAPIECVSRREVLCGWRRSGGPHLPRPRSLPTMRALALPLGGGNRTAQTPTRLPCVWRRHAWRDSSTRYIHYTGTGRKRERERKGHAVVDSLPRTASPPGSISVTCRERNSQHLFLGPRSLSVFELIAIFNVSIYL